MQCFMALAIWSKLTKWDHCDKKNPVFLGKAMACVMSEGFHRNSYLVHSWFHTLESRTRAAIFLSFNGCRDAGCAAPTQFQSVSHRRRSLFSFHCWWGSGRLSSLGLGHRVIIRYLDEATQCFLPQYLNRSHGFWASRSCWSVDLSPTLGAFWSNRSG